MVVLFVLLLAGLSYGGLIIKPDDAVKKIFPNHEIQKKSIMIDKKTRDMIQKKFKTKMKTSIFRIYLIKKDGNTIGYGILHSHRVRTKKETVLFILDKNCRIKDIEVIAFYEPPEYIPPDKWFKNFENKGASEIPAVKKNIPNITGATLSSRAITDASRQVIGICDLYLREKFR